jgi:ADP-ribose pyrophosphatase YjhB (NUDIX family)
MAASGGMWVKGTFIPAERRRHATSTSLRGDVVEFNKSPKPGLVLNGVALAPAERGFWKGATDQALGETSWPASSKSRSTGAVVIEPDGRLWVYEPSGHYGGYQHTFPKGRVEKGLTAQQTALKEVFEETGLQVRLTGFLGHFEGDTTITRYYVARRVGGAPWTAHWEAAKVKLVTPAAAKKMLNKQRDQDILAALLKQLEA